MTPTPHASVDQVADLLEGLLPAGESMRVNAHLAGCADCRGQRDALLDVTARLAAEGASPEPMPADLAGSLHAAIISASAGVAAPGAHSADPLPFPRVRRPLSWLAGAAAVVVIAAAGVAGWRALPHDGAATSSSVDGQYRANGGEAGMGSSSGSGPAAASGRSPDEPLAPSTSKPLEQVPALAPGRVAAAARNLASTGNTSYDARPLAQASCATPAGGATVALVRWHGSIAVLAVDISARTATILDCRTAHTVLYSTGY